MALLQLFTNNAIALLQTSIGPSSNTIHVQAGLGAEFPQPVNPGEFFLVTLESTGAPLVREIVKITGRTGDILHVGARGLEGTTPQAWAAINTLVDHRITAETIRQAFLQPVYTPTGGSGGIVYTPTDIPPSTVQGVSTHTYSDTNRLKKFWIEMYDPVTGNAQALEVLVIIQGILNLNNETASFVQSHRLGYNFKGSVQLSLDVLNKQITLEWHNAETTASVIVTITSI
jgi:hypothetical protein